MGLSKVRKTNPRQVDAERSFYKPQNTIHQRGIFFIETVGSKPYNFVRMRRKLNTDILKIGRIHNSGKIFKSLLSKINISNMYLNAFSKSAILKERTQNVLFLPIFQL